MTIFEKYPVSTSQLGCTGGVQCVSFGNLVCFIHAYRSAATDEDFKGANIFVPLYSNGVLYSVEVQTSLYVGEYSVGLGTFWVNVYPDGMTIAEQPAMYTRPLEDGEYGLIDLNALSYDVGKFLKGSKLPL